MAKDFRGIGDARPASSPAANEKGQGGHTPATGDWKGEADARNSSSPSDCEHVNIGNVAGSGPSKY